LVFSDQRTQSRDEAGILEEKMTEMTLAEEIAQAAAGRVHALAAYLVDGKHQIAAGQYQGIMAYLLRCPERGDAERTMTGADRYFEGRATASSEYRDALSGAHVETQQAVIADIPGGFYATESATGNNDFDFWKVIEGKRDGYRFAKRVIGGGDQKYPKLVDISNQQQLAALRAILREGIEKAAEQYAVNQQRCMKCGIHLTDETSRAARMGPTCRGER
jgi:hypothetical protein